MEIAIVIPCLDEKANLMRLLPALKAQRYDKSWHVNIYITVTDITDSSVEAAKFYNANILHYTGQFNHGSVRNWIVNSLKEEYIIFTVADALPLSNYWIKELVSPLVENNDVVACSGMQIAGSSENPFFFNSSDRIITSNLQTYFKEQKKELRLLNGTWEKLSQFDKRSMLIIDNTTSCIRKSYFQSIGIEPSPYAEDLLMSYRALKSGKILVKNPKASVLHSHTRTIRYSYKRAFLEQIISLRLCNFIRTRNYFHFGMKLVHIISDIFSVIFSTHNISFISKLSLSKYFLLTGIGRFFGQIEGYKFAVSHKDTHFLKLLSNFKSLSRPRKVAPVKK